MLTWDPETRKRKIHAVYLFAHPQGELMQPLKNEMTGALSDLF